MELKGKFCKDCVIMTDNIEESAISQVYDIINNPAFNRQKVRIMTDVHAGKSGPIGLTTTIGDFVNPDHVGCDIGCSVSMLLLDKILPKESYEVFEHRVKKSIPMGIAMHSKVQFNEKDFYKFVRQEFSKAVSKFSSIEVPTINEAWVSDFLKKVHMDEGKFYKSLGTLGSGNHFLEYAENESGTQSAFIIHTGSRNFGLKVYKYWANIAKKTPKVDNKEIVKRIKAENADKSTWSTLIKQAQEEAIVKYPSGYLFGENLNGYLSDMVFAQAYASWNHHIIQSIVSDILLKFGIKVNDIVVSRHNYIDFGDFILRKGAIRAYEGERLIIPLNMHDGTILGVGKSNADWNCSAPHGSGRAMSRSEAKRKITLEAFKTAMEGVYSTSVVKGTIDESPMAYKPSNEALTLTKDTCEILDVFKPKINWKASETVDEN